MLFSKKGSFKGWNLPWKPQWEAFEVYERRGVWILDNVGACDRSRTGSGCRYRQKDGLLTDLNKIIDFWRNLKEYFGACDKLWACCFSLSDHRQKAVCYEQTKMINIIKEWALIRSKAGRNSEIHTHGFYPQTASDASESLFIGEFACLTGLYSPGEISLTICLYVIFLSSGVFSSQ